MCALDRGSGWILFAAVLLLTGCSGARLMMPTPKVYLDANLDLYENLAPELKSTEVPLFYITDRVPEQGEDGNLRYGSGRSSSLAFGTTVVDLGTEITWEELVEASRTESRLKPVKLDLRTIKEIVRGPNAPLPYKIVDGQIVEEPTLVTLRNEAAEEFRRVLVQSLALTQRKEVFIYIHGYNNSFDDAAFAMKLFQSPRGRIGTFGPEQLTHAIEAGLEFSTSNMAVVDCSGVSDAANLPGDRYGHSYFRNSPTVSSDLLLMLRDDLDPGEAGRPLEHLGLHFWRIPPGYPGRAVVK